MIRNKVILCIDDDGDDRYLIRQSLSTHLPNLQILEAGNGREALGLLKASKVSQELPCMILLDINMPILDGKQTLEKIREDSDLEEVPVVVLTTSANPADRAFFSSRGVNMITKPFDYRMLVPLLTPFLHFCE